jgi:molecular chaperone Hsp33
MPVSRDRWVKCISTGGSIRGVAIHATSLIQDMVARHSLSGEPARALGEAVIGALTIGSYCKAGERVNLNIRGSGVVRQALVDAYPDGRVRGYVVPRSEPEAEDSRFGPWGEGVVSVLRTKGAEGEKPYIGTVPLITGHLAKDLTFYWHQSEQIPSAVGLAVNLQGGRITEAGGFLVQAMPGASPSEVRLIEQHIHEIQSLASSLARDAEPLHLLSQIFQSTAFVVLEETPLRFECTCSLERVTRALTLIGTAELRDILAKDNGASVRCDFCSREYRLDRTVIESLIASVSG